VSDGCFSHQLQLETPNHRPGVCLPYGQTSVHSQTGDSNHGCRQRTIRAIHSRVLLCKCTIYIWAVDMLGALGTDHRHITGCSRLLLCITFLARCHHIETRRSSIKRRDNTRKEHQGITQLQFQRCRQPQSRPRPQAVPHAHVGRR